MLNSQLKTTLRTLYEYADEIEKKASYNRIGKNSLRDYVRFDMLKFLLWLSDEGKLNPAEREFVNDVLGFRYTVAEFGNFYKTLKISESFDKKMPDAFEAFKEAEENGDVKGTSTIYSDFYRLIGICFINSDQLATESEIYKLTEFIIRLRGLEGDSAFPESSGESPKKAPSRSYDEVIEELNSLIGLEAVKEDVKSIANLVRVRKLREERGFKQADMSLHLVFTGNPGTGKTTVARLLGELYCALGVLSSGHLFETDRSGLVAGYVGQTALKVNEAVEKAMGGILFIDEAYALAPAYSANDFGGEAIATLLKQMEDHRDNLIVIVAGYTSLMESFLQSNPGLRSRFNKYIHFADYDEDEMMGILESNCKKMQMSMTKKATDSAREAFEQKVARKGTNFANGRDVRNYFEKAITNQANRIASLESVSDEMLNTIIFADVKQISI
ncbi:MAG: AAA family ATPase [Eubacteriaceae bacterium]|nr:AAA family ATPase [Eubacteriaceae bacterium]